MLKNRIERLFWPTVVFLLFAILFKLVPGRLMDISATAEGFKDVMSKAFGIGLGLAFAWLCVRLIDVFIWRSLETRLETTIPRLLKDIAAVMVFIIAGITLAKVVFNQPVTAVWATSGVIAFVLGLALQNTIADLFCGVALNVDQPFKIDEWIEIRPRSVDPIRGCVTEISWRSTRIRTTSNTLGYGGKSMISSIMNELTEDVARGDGEALNAVAVAYGVEKQDRAHFAAVLHENFNTIFPSENVTAAEVNASIDDIMRNDSRLSKYAV